MRKQERTSQKRRADEQGRQLDLFEPAHEDLEHVGDSRPHGQEPPERAHAVDLEGANEYGLPAQLPLFEAMEPVQEGEGAKAVSREDNAPREGEWDPASGRQQDAQQEPEDAPDAFLKLVARIALRAGQKEAKQEGGDHESRSVPEGEQRGTG